MSIEPRAKMSPSCVGPHILGDAYFHMPYQPCQLSQLRPNLVVFGAEMFQRVGYYASHILRRCASMRAIVVRIFDTARAGLKATWTWMQFANGAITTNAHPSFPFISRLRRLHT